MENTALEAVIALKLTKDIKQGIKKLSPSEAEIKTGEKSEPKMFNKDKEWKRLIIEILVKLKIIDAGFTGRIILNINQGGLSDIERVERLK